MSGFVEVCFTCGERISQHAPTCTALSPLLDDVERFVTRFVTFTNNHQSAAAALWTAHVVAIDAAPAAGYLRITSAAEESGKTTLLEVLQLLLGERALNAVSVTPAAVFRTRDRIGPVALLLDEVDNTLRERKDDGARDLLALVNAGYRRSARVMRTVGPQHEPKAFQAFGPCAIAGLGNLHPTTESRCIPIVLDRKLRGTGERWLPHLLENDAANLRQRLEGAVLPLVETLRTAMPNLPSELRDRHAEVWWGMFAIADEAGADWASRARRAAVALHGNRDDSATLSVGVLLLQHIRRAFEDAGSDRMPTTDLLAALVESEEGPWGRWWGQEINREGPPRAASADLARHLRPFGVKPRVIRSGERTPRGYVLEDFADPFTRYLSDPPATPATHATHLASTVASVAPVAGGSGERG